jgi:hypothetical protein
MKVNLIDVKKRVIETYENVLSFSETFIVFNNNGYKGYVYAGENEKFVKVEK